MSMFLSVVAGQGGIKVPGAPGTLSLAAGSPDTTVIDLSWSAPSDTGGGTISGYRIKKDGSVLVADTSSTGTTYSATGLTQNTSYNFTVAAINEKGTGADGNTPSLSTAQAKIEATGGTTEEYGSYKSHTFTGVGTFEITANLNSDTFDVLVIAGGGSGFWARDGMSAQGGGGGGAGAYRVSTGQTGTVQTYAVVIGAGGISTGGYRGASSEFASIESTGGKYGGTSGAGDSWFGDNTGASGGGGGSSPGNSTDPAGGTGGTYGNDGGQGIDSVTWPYTGGAGGGGGGSGAVGSPGTKNTGSPYEVIGGAGGAGTSNTYRDGTGETRAGGGGGSGYSNDGTGPAEYGAGGSGGGGRGGTFNNGVDNVGVNGGANTGSGGGGAAGNANQTGGNGGSGIVIIRYAF